MGRCLPGSPFSNLSYVNGLKFRLQRGSQPLQRNRCFGLTGVPVNWRHSPEYNDSSLNPEKNHCKGINVRFCFDLFQCTWGFQNKILDDIYVYRAVTNHLCDTQMHPLKLCCLYLFVYLLLFLFIQFVFIGSIHFIG